MSLEHRNNPDSEECARLTLENAAYVRFLQAPKCPHCGSPGHTDNDCRERPDDEPDCPHDEHDHGICLSCGADIHDRLVGQAEDRADALSDR